MFRFVTIATIAITAIDTIGGPEQGAYTGIAKSYQSDGQAFIDALTNAISTMEGATKDSLHTFFTTDVQKFVTEDLPAAINGMSVLLEANRKNFEEVDQKIADSISGGGN